MDADRQWFKAKVGLDACSTDRNSSFCAWTLLPHAPEVLVVEDAEQDTRFEANPLVKGDPKIRFYAGAPLITADGTRLGSLCVIDTKPRKFTQEQAQARSSPRMCKLRTGCESPVPAPETHSAAARYAIVSISPASCRCRS